MTEIIVFLIAFTAAALAVVMIALAVVFAIMCKNYKSKETPTKMLKKEEP